MRIGGHRISDDAPCFIIAEVGINHGGNAALCAKMMRAAAEAGADAVKLQTVTPDESYHPDTPSYRAFKDSVLSEAALGDLMRQAEDMGILLFSTPGDPTALALMDRVGMPAIKISSGLLTNLPIVRKAARLGKPMILSSGMAYAREVEAAVNAARAAGARDIAVLHCTSLYPAPSTSLNLAAIRTLRADLGIPVGYSDHHAGSLASVAAVAMGACIIEKHFTLDATTVGADHAISLEPEAFAEMARAIRSVGRMRGLAEKAPVAAEIPMREGNHRRLVLARDLAAGHALGEEDLYLMRLLPDAPGLPAADLDRVLGRVTRIPLKRLAGLTEDMLKEAPE